jgi:hypothetical protein
MTICVCRPDNLVVTGNDRPQQACGNRLVFTIRTGA